MARRAVMKLSWKWRSGRERLRVGFIRPSGRGGEMPHAFGDDERVAAKGYRDVVVPTRKATALVVVDPELSLQVLVDALGSPALHDEADELLPGDAVRHGDEEVVGRLWRALAPLDEKPEGLLLALGHSRGDNATHGEARPEVLTGAAAPGATSKAPAL